MEKIVYSLFQKSLIFLQKKYHELVSLDMLSRANSDPTFMVERIITGDETWVYEFDVQTGPQSPEWKTKDEPKPKLKNHC